MSLQFCFVIDLRLCSELECALDSRASGREFDAWLVINFVFLVVIELSATM